MEIPLHHSPGQIERERERERERESKPDRESYFNFQNLRRAYLDCRKHKQKTHSAAEFEINFESELLTLERELRNRTYRPDRSICFVVEDPSLREVFAGTFCDRVVHHLLYNYLEPIFEPKFIHGSYACRKEKGTHQSLRDVQKAIRKTTKNQSEGAYFMHLDIRGFFVALNKEILSEIISRKVKNPEILWLANLIIFNDPVKNFICKGDRSLFAKIPTHKSLFHAPEGQGLPIGNLTSQFFANVYMDELDQFVKHKLKIRHYFRYVDDFLILSKDREQLKRWRNKIKDFLKERLKLELHPSKQVLQPVDRGIDWLGYIVKPDCVLVRRRIVRTFKRKLGEFNASIALSSGGETGEERNQMLEKMLATINAYFGIFQHADTYTLRKHLFEKHFYLLTDYIEPADGTLSFFRIKTKPEILASR